MTSMELDKQVEQFLADHQAAILEDIKRLIRVPSVGTTFIRIARSLLVPNALLYCVRRSSWPRGKTCR